MHTGALRVEVIAAMAPAVQDLMLTGHDAAYVVFLVIPGIAARCRLATELAEDAPLKQKPLSAEARAATEQGLHILNTEGAGSSTFAPRALLLEEAPNIDAGEITYKRYINRRALLAQRQALVQTLHAIRRWPE